MVADVLDGGGGVCGSSTEVARRKDPPTSASGEVIASSGPQSTHPTDRTRDKLAPTLRTLCGFICARKARDVIETLGALALPEPCRCSAGIFSNQQRTGNEDRKEGAGNQLDRYRSTLCIENSSPHALANNCLRDRITGHSQLRRIAAGSHGIKHHSQDVALLCGGAKSIVGDAVNAEFTAQVDIAAGECQRTHADACLPDSRDSNMLYTYASGAMANLCSRGKRTVYILPHALRIDTSVYPRSNVEIQPYAGCEHGKNEQNREVPSNCQETQHTDAMRTLQTIAIDTSVKRHRVRLSSQPAKQNVTDSPAAPARVRVPRTTP